MLTNLRTYVLQVQSGDNTKEATKNICCIKDEDAVDHSNQMNQMIEKTLFRLQRTSMISQCQAGWKIVNSKAVLKAIIANLASSTQRVSGKLGISQSSMVHHPQDIAKLLTHSSSNGKVP